MRYKPATLQTLVSLMNVEICEDCGSIVLAGCIADHDRFHEKVERGYDAGLMMGPIG